MDTIKPGPSKKSWKRIAPGEIEVTPDLTDCVIMVRFRDLAGYVSLIFAVDSSIGFEFGAKLIDAAQAIEYEQVKRLAELEQDWVDKNLAATDDTERGRFFHYLEASKELRRILGYPEHDYTPKDPKEALKDPEDPNHE
ncbi:MAG: hypothetical protein KAQ99_07350 [Candidatus Aureabacteria bacterium]|nr:hypothetical protein [Candidatus Auribacterota bacterium]